MRFAFAVVIVAAMAACAPTAQKHEPPLQTITVTPQPGQSKSLPAPAVPGAVVRISADDAGKTIPVAVGQTFQIELRGVPTAGYLWAPASVPAFLEKTAETGGDTTTDQSKPGFTGGSHWEVFAFRATAPGKGAVLLEQRRPWEKTEPPSQTFTVTIEAK